MFRTIGNMNITRELRINLTSGDFSDDAGFFIRSAVDAVIKYLPFDATTDAEAITKTVSASPYFIDPVLCKKVFRLITSPDSDIYIGYGV
jgi:hypothetical protein